MDWFVRFLIGYIKDDQVKNISVLIDDLQAVIKRNMPGRSVKELYSALNKLGSMRKPPLLCLKAIYRFQKFKN